MLTTQILIVDDITNQFLLLNLLWQLCMNFIQHFRQHEFIHHYIWLMQNLIYLIFFSILIYIYAHLMSRPHVIYLQLHKLSPTIKQNALNKIITLQNLSIILLLFEVLLSNVRIIINTHANIFIYIFIEHFLFEF